MKFRLSRLSPGATITKFFVYNSSGDTIGSINVPNEAADALERHWLGGTIQPQASALATSTRRKENALVAEMLATRQRSKASPPPAAPRSKQENPMVAAMVAAAPKHRLTRAAILRGC
jgi:hypothetical protein